MPSIPVSPPPDAAPENDVFAGDARSVVVELDAAALELARAAGIAEASSEEHVGEFLGAFAEDEIAVTATFIAKQPGYSGWHWSVTLAILSDASPTVSEVVLLPGEGALLAPAWIPWEQRIRPGDVGVGDLLPPMENDRRLVPAYLQSDDPAVEAVAHELGLGRIHVLSREGRLEFAERLHTGSFGPTDEMALTAPAQCFSCGFYLPLAGSLGQLSGACSNEFSPADGRVVDAGYGCGAHSETVIQMPARSAAGVAVIDELSLEVHRRAGEASSARTAARADVRQEQTGAAEDEVEEDGVVEDAVERDGDLLELPEPVDLIDESVLFGAADQIGEANQSVELPTGSAEDSPAEPGAEEPEPAADAGPPAD